MLPVPSDKEKDDSIDHMEHRKYESDHQAKPFNTNRSGNGSQISAPWDDSGESGQ